MPAHFLLFCLINTAGWRRFQYGALQPLIPLYIYCIYLRKAYRDNNTADVIKNDGQNIRASRECRSDKPYCKYRNQH